MGCSHTPLEIKFDGFSFATELTQMALRRPVMGTEAGALQERDFQSLITGCAVVQGCSRAFGLPPSCRRPYLPPLWVPFAPYAVFPRGALLGAGPGFPDGTCSPAITLRGRGAAVKSGSGLRTLFCGLRFHFDGRGLTRGGRCRGSWDGCTSAWNVQRPCRLLWEFQSFGRLI